MVVLCFCLGTVCLFDYTRQKIPNHMIILLLTLGIWLSHASQGWMGIFQYLSVAGVVVLLLYPFFRLHTLGAGDVKLLAVCAGIFPLQKVLSFLFFSFVFTAVFSLIPILRERNLLKRVRYFGDYCMDVVQCGQWKPYCPATDGNPYSGVCMSGPVLCSVLAHWGGVL